MRINRIRRFYVPAAPGLAEHLGVTAPTDDIADVLALDGYERSRWQILFSVVGMIGVINGVLADAALWPSVITGLVVFLITVPLHQAYQLRARLRKPWPFIEPEPEG